MKFTFKTENPTGRYSSFYSSTHYIKLTKKQVGTISDKKPYLIKLMVVKKDINEDGHPNCKWKYITLKKESESLQEAKDFLNKNIETIRSQFELHLLEE